MSQSTDSPAPTSSPAPFGAAAPRRRIEIALGLPLSMRGPSYTCASLAEAAASPEFGVHVHTPWASSALAHAAVHPVLDMPKLLNQLAFRYGRRRVIAAMERNILTALDKSGDDLVWAFGELPLSISRSLSRRGVRVVREKINCAKAHARAILCAEHDRLGLPPFTGISPASVAKEAEEFALATAVFCPSPMVKASLLAQGVPPEKCLETSYGWDPARFAGESVLPLPPATSLSSAGADGPTLIFAGSLIVRKGIHILLEAWDRANIGGRLLLVGAPDPVVEARWGHLLARPDIIRPGYIDDIAAAYRAADWFVFPSLEEGSPLVTYEAAGCGLPALVTPMGAGAFTRHGHEGLIVDSLDPEAWAALFASLPSRMAEQKTMAKAARARADSFTWHKVGARRREQLLALPPRPGS